MFDLGIYALNTIRWFSGEEPVDFRTLVATRDKTGKFNSVEETVNCLLKFRSGILAECGSSYGQSGTNFFQINGTTGYVRVEPAFTYGDTILKYVGKTESGDVAGSGAVYDPDQFVTEVTHFANCVLQNTEPATPGEEGLKDLLSVEEIYKAAGSSMA